MRSQLSHSSAAIALLAASVSVVLVSTATPARANPSNNMVLLGNVKAQVLLHPHVYIVKFGIGAFDPLNLVTYTTNFVKGIGRTPWNQGVTISAANGYVGWGNSNSSVPRAPKNTLDAFTLPSNEPIYIDTWTDNTAFPDTPSMQTLATFTAAIAASASRGVAHFNVKDDLNAVILVLTGPRFYSPLTTMTGKSYHQMVSNGIGNYKTPFIAMLYAASGGNMTAPLPGGHFLVPKDGDDENAGPNPDYWLRGRYSAVLDHEMVEVITDPRPEPSSYGWNTPSTAPQGEIADKLTNLSSPFTPATGLQVKLLDNSVGTTLGGQDQSVFTLAPMWSNNLANAATGNVPDGDMRAAMFVADRAHLAMKNSLASGTLQVSYNDGAWTDWGRPANSGALSASPSGVAWQDRMHVFSYASNGHLYHNSSTDGAHGFAQKLGWDDWGAPPEANGSFVNAPSVVSYGPDEMDIFAVTAPSFTLWQRRYSLELVANQRRWIDTGWLSLGTAPVRIASGPGAVVSIGEGYQPRYAVYFVDQNGRLGALDMFNSWDIFNTFKAWRTISDSPILAQVNPAVAEVTYPGMTDVVALDASAPAVWHLHGNSWENLGAPPDLQQAWVPSFIGAPGAYSGTTGAIRVTLTNWVDGSVWIKDIQGMFTVPNFPFSWETLTSASPSSVARGIGMIAF